MADETTTVIHDAEEALRIGLPFPLTDAESELIAASRQGVAMRSTVKADEDGTSVSERERPLVRAAVIAVLCTSTELNVHAHGVQLQGCRVSGELDLRESTMRVPLTITDCELPDAVTLTDASLPSLTIKSCRLDATLAAARAKVDGCVDLTGSRLVRGVQLYDADIGGDLLCADAIFGHSNDGLAIAAQGVRIAADIALMGASISGGISLTQAKVGRSIYCNGAEFRKSNSKRSQDDIALAFDGGRAASIFLGRGPRPSTDGAGISHAFKCLGSVNLSGAHIGDLIGCGVQIESAQEALSLWGAQVERNVDLRTVAIGGSESLEDARSVIHRTTLRGGLNLFQCSIGSDLMLDGAYVSGRPAVTGAGLRLRGTLTFGVARDFQGDPVEDREGQPIRGEAVGGVYLFNAQIGSISASAATFRARPSDSLFSPGVAPDHVALSLWGASVAQDVELSTVIDLQQRGWRCEIVGQLDLEATTIGRNLTLDGLDIRPCAEARPKDGVPTVIDAQRLEVRGEMRCGTPTGANDQLLRDGSDAQIRFIAGGSIVLTAANLGSLSLVGARIDARSMSLAGARIDAHAGTALLLRSAEVSRNVELTPVCSQSPDGSGQYWAPLVCDIDGRVDLGSARVGGTLDCRGAALNVSEGTALEAGGASFGSVVLAQYVHRGKPVRREDGTPVRFQSSGAVVFTNATVRETLTCRGGRFMGAAGAKEAALQLYGVDIGADLILAAPKDYRRAAPGDAPRFEADGVALVSARIGLHLELKGASVTAPAGVCAIDAQNATAGGHVKLDELDCAGVINLRSLSAHTLTYQHGTLAPRPSDDSEGESDTDPTLFDAEGLRLSGSLEWWPDSVDGRVSLRGATVDSIKDDPNAESPPPPAADKHLRAAGVPRWPGMDGSVGSTDLDGLTYASIKPEDWKMRKAWLAAQPAPLGQPYLQLAAVYRATGDDRAARKVSMERFNVRLRGPHKQGPALQRGWRWLLRVFIGHGYEPWRILPWLAATWLVVWLVVAAAATSRHMVPTAAGVNTKLAPTDCRRRDYSCLEPALFAIDDVVPVIDLGQTSAWHAAGSAGYVLTPALGRFVGWFLTTLVIAGMTGLIRRE